MVFRWLHKLPRLNVLRTSSRSEEKSHKQQESRASPTPRCSVTSTNNTRHSSDSNTTRESEQALGNAFRSRNEEHLKARLSGKVFPSQRGAAAVTAQQSHRHAIAVAADDDAPNSSSIKLRRVKCLFSVLRSPFKWPSCVQPRKSSSRGRLKRANFRKMLVKLQKRACFSSCRTNASTSNHLPISPKVAVPSDTPAAPINRSQLQQLSAETPPALPVPQSPSKRCNRRSPSTSDPEYWINSDSDYVDLVMTSDTKKKAV